MEKTLTTLEHTKKSEWVYVIYDIDEVYVRECSTLAEVAKYFGVTKQALSNHLRRTNQKKDNFSYKSYSVEFFDVNGIY